MVKRSYFFLNGGSKNTTNGTQHSRIQYSNIYHALLSYGIGHHFRLLHSREWKNGSGGHLAFSSTITVSRAYSLECRVPDISINNCKKNVVVQLSFFCPYFMSFSDCQFQDFLREGSSIEVRKYFQIRKPFNGN